MNINKEIEKIAKEITNPIRNLPDYGRDDILSQLAEHAGLDLEKEREKNDVRSGTENH